MSKVITFGEIMLRLSTEGYQRFIQATKYNAHYGGGEANVAVSLANFGIDVAFVTKLPRHEIGKSAVNTLRSFGVNVDHISYGGERIGLYYIEKGASQRPSKVIYDRAASSISLAAPHDFNWEEVFKDASWFHFTGITPALSQGLVDICLEACKEAKKRDITISCDLNYRKKLWSPDSACKAMTKLCNYVDVCIANEEDAANIFGIKAANTNIIDGTLDHIAYEEVAHKLVERFGFQKVAITLRSSISASDNNWSAMLYDNGCAFYSKTYPVHIVDRVGGGDSFAAALIYSILKNDAPQDVIDFAVAASCLKHSVEGDFNLVTVDEVTALKIGDGSGRVQR